MQQSWRPRHLKPVAGQHAVRSNRGFGLLKRPGRVVNLIAPQPSARVSRIQAVTLGQPVFQGTEARPIRLRCRPIETLESGVSPRRPVCDSSSTFGEGHGRLEVGEVKETSCRPHRERVCGVEAQKPHAGFPVSLHISPHVQFREGGNPREVGCVAPHHSGHPKRHHRDPRSTVELLKRESFGNQRTQSGRVDRPMREKKIPPGLTPGPGRRGNGPRPVIEMGERGVQAQNP